MTEFDSTILTIIIIAMLCTIPIVYFFARWKDLSWRGQIFRKYLKQDTHMLYILSKDEKGIKPRLINFQDDALNIADKIWLVKKGRIYRRDKPEMGAYLEKKNVKWEEGLPVIFLDYDTLKPRDFYPEESTAKPGELGSVLSAWVNNQLAKGMAAIKNQDMILKIIAVLCVISVFLAYTAMDTAGKTLDEVKKLEQPAQPKGTAGTVVNGSLVITQPGVKPNG